MAEFTSYELEKMKLQQKENIKKAAKQKRAFQIKLVAVTAILIVAVALIYRFADRGSDALDNAMRKPVPVSKG